MFFFFVISFSFVFVFFSLCRTVSPPQDQRAIFLNPVDMQFMGKRGGGKTWGKGKEKKKKNTGLLLGRLRPCMHLCMYNMYVHTYIHIYMPNLADMGKTRGERIPSQWPPLTPPLPHQGRRGVWGSPCPPML